MYIASRSFFAVPRCRVTKVALSQIHYDLVPQLLLQMGIIYPTNLQAVQYIKEYLLNALYRVVCVFWQITTNIAQDQMLKFVKTALQCKTENIHLFLPFEGNSIPSKVY